MKALMGLAASIIRPFSYENLGAKKYEFFHL